MNYYTANAANGADGIVPSVPAGVSWAGAYDPATKTYLIATPADLSGVPGVTAVADLAVECQKRGLAVGDVLRWSC